MRTACLLLLVGCATTPQIAWPTDSTVLDALGEALRAEYEGAREGPVFVVEQGIATSTPLCREREQHCTSGPDPAVPGRQSHECSNVCMEEMIVRVHSDGRVTAQVFDIEVRYEDMPNSPWFLSQTSFGVVRSEPRQSNAANRDLRRIVRGL